MKAWFNEKGNWCFEFEKEEQETSRLIILVSKGVNYWRKLRDEYPEAFISAQLFDSALGVIFIGQNYSQSKPTIEKPIVITARQLIESCLRQNIDFNEEELEILRTRKWEELL